MVMRFLIIGLLQCCFVVAAQAQLHYTKVDEILKVYANNNSPSVAIDLASPFMVAYQAKHTVKSKFGSFHLKEQVAITYHQPTVDTITANTDCISLSGTIKSRQGKCPFEMVFTYDSIKGTVMTVTVSDTQINAMDIVIQSNASEHFFGGGEQYSHMDLKGHKVPLLVDEQGIGRGDKGITGFTKLLGVSGSDVSTYFPMPWVMSTDGRGLLLEGYQYMLLDLRKPSSITVHTWGNHVTCSVMQDPSPMALLTRLTQLVGRMPMMPTWAHGTVMGVQGGAARVTKLVDDALKAGNPITAVWIQDWVGKRATKFGSRLWWNWEPDSSTYGNMKAFCTQMNAKGVKVLGYVNPFLAPEGHLGTVAAKRGYVVENKQGQNYKVPAGGFDAYLLDLTNPDAVAWMKNIIKANLVGNGFSGWMADFGEWLPFDAVLYNGEDAAVYHNQYAQDWAKLNRQVLDEEGKVGDLLFFSRSGYRLSPSYSTLVWAGDQMHTYGKNDGLPSAISAIISSGMSGVTNNHSDIGGYTTVKMGPLKYVRSMDLLFRWAEVNTFMPFFRTHEGLKPDLNVQFYSNDSTERFFARLGKIHLALKPYFQYLEQQANQYGYPIVRHPYLEFPTDTNTYRLQYQFMLGSDLMVVPVIKKNSTQVSGYLPQGQWQNVWTGETYGQGYHTFSAPYGKPAVFYRVGGEWSNRLKQLLNPSNQ